MNALATKKQHTPKEYLTMERASREKHQFIGGEIFAMAGCSIQHDSISASILIAFGGRLRGGPCQPHTPDMRLYISATGDFVYSDGFIVCRPEFTDAAVDTVTNPCVVVEVLSPSTEKHDREGKFEGYKSIPTLRDYLLFSQDRVFIEHFHREADGSWACRQIQTGQVLRLTALPIEVPAEDLYPWGFAR